MQRQKNLLIAALAAFFVATFSGTAATSKPNIIFILADDLGYGDVGCYGQKKVKTPNIDKLAEQGTRFTQCYAGSTVCAPSRCVLMTGLHTGHSRIRGNGGGLSLLPEDISVPKALKSSGYTTALIGKWGLGNEKSPGEPVKQGFDYSYGYLNQTHAHDYYTDHLVRNGERVEKSKKDYSHDLFAQEALDFVKTNTTKPFFLYLAFTIPHSRIDPPSEDPYARENWPAEQRKRAAMVTRMDKDVGRLMSELNELGLDENTIVFFTSDNGPAKEGFNPEFFDCNGPLRGIKRDLYDGGIREPMIVRWPGKVKAGATSDQVWAFWDFLPTAAELAGAKVPKNIDGESMLPALLGKKKIEHQPLYWEFYEHGFQQAVRMGDWKAVRLAPDKPLELYNIASDVGETKDVAAQNPKVVEKIEKFLKTARTHHPLEPKGNEPVKKSKKKRKGK